MFGKKVEMINASDALPGREEEMKITGVHVLTGNNMKAPYSENFEIIVFGLGCFWGAERKFWQLNDQYGHAIFSTAVGYSAGFTPNPTYQEVCSGMTGHNEVVQVVFDPFKISFDELLKVFWESHNPTQGMRQGNDQGSQYRSGIYCSTTQQLEKSLVYKEAYQESLKKAGHPNITTEIVMASEFYYAEEYHQQYLHKNPAGYCGLGGTGVDLVAP